MDDVDRAHRPASNLGVCTSRNPAFRPFPRHRREFMSRPRITLAGLMSVVLYAAFGCAALTNASHFWADAAYTISIISIVRAESSFTN